MTAEQEREAVVAYLDSVAKSKRQAAIAPASYLNAEAMALEQASRAIEAGHHLSRNPDNPRK